MTFEFLSFGAGVNSTAALILFRPRVVIFAGTGDEYPETYAYVERYIRPFVTSCGGRFITVRKALTPILDALKIPRCGFHAFRHTHTSLLLQSGATVPVTQAQLQHSDPRVTIGIYGHVIGDAHREAVEKVASILDPSGPKSGPLTQLIQ